MYSGNQEARRKNPRRTASFLSFVTFGYTLGLFKKGYTGQLSEDDIYQVPKHCGSRRCCDKIEQNWQYSRNTLKLLIRAFGKKYLLYSTIHLTWHLISSTVHPIAMSRFIAYFDKNQTQHTRSDALYYGGLLVCLYLFRSLWIHNYYMLEGTLGIQIQASLTAFIYRKVLKIPPDKLTENKTGNVITVLTKDIRTVNSIIWTLSDIFIGGVKFFYITYLLYNRIGVMAFFATGFVVTMILIQGIMGKFILKLRLKAGGMSDKRLNLTREILSVLKIIKMYTWEAFFHKKLCDARLKETKANLRGWFLGASSFSIGLLFGKLIFPIFLLIYLSFGYPADTELVYYLMNLLKDYVGVMPNGGLGLAAEFYAAILRIGKILNMTESVSEAIAETNEKDKTSKVKFENAVLSLNGNPILDGISFNVNSPGLYVITGPLGSGKSSVFKVILKEYPLSGGQIEVCGTISYASQDPWLFPATVKQNILFGQTLDDRRYEKVIEVCCLVPDFEVLPYGDHTIVLDGGLNLSKGQQARINLARAVYKDSSIYLLDDPLACLDVKVQDTIFRSCIKEFLQDRIVFFITQDDRYLQQASKVFTLEHGQIKSISSRTKENQTDLLNNSDDHFNNLLNNNLKEDSQVKVYQEDKNTGEVDWSNYFKYVKYGGGVLISGILLLIFVGCQGLESYTDKTLSKWVDYQQNNSVDNQTADTKFNQTTLLQRDNIFDQFIILSVVSTLLDLGKSYWFLVYCRKASINFHKLMSRKVIHCAITFLDRNFIGNILNRFSYDMDHIDEVFPFLIQDFITVRSNVDIPGVPELVSQTAVLSIGGTLVIVAIVDWTFIFISLFFLITLALIRMFCIPTARALKRLVAMTRSPFIGHLNATIEGLSTIKAFKAQNLLAEEFDKHQDLAISALYMELTTSRAFGYVLDFNCSIITAVIVFTFLFINKDTSVGNVGLVLSQTLTMSSNLTWMVRTWANIEQTMTSVERVVEYIEITQEPNEGQTVLKWPSQGKVEFKEVSLIYSFDSKVLKNVSFIINPREKVGIVGRTGAGKSSIISVLFRLYDYQGFIEIDGVNIKNISLECLRRNISLIPQDPVIFAGSIRENVDPLDTCLDKDIWRVLKNVQLHHLVPNLDENILNITLSTGQKQLLCIARALLRNNKIVVMDEPTANLDAESDSLVHDLIEQYFKGCTVIMIAHRLHSTLNLDKVIVMKNAKIIEFDSPSKLLENKQSLYYQMINVGK